MSNQLSELYIEWDSGRYDIESELYFDHDHMSDIAVCCNFLMMKLPVKLNTKTNNVDNIGGIIYMTHRVFDILKLQCSLRDKNVLTFNGDKVFFAKTPIKII